MEKVLDFFEGLYLPCIFLYLPCISRVSPVYLPYKVLDFFEDLRSRVPERRHQARCRGNAREMQGRYLHALYLPISPCICRSRAG